MSRRAAAAEATRRKIVEATFEVHGEQGIASARIEDIARRAGVGVATVYRHFPTYDELVGACGDLTFDLFPPPDPRAAPEALEPLREPGARLRRLVDELYGFYERTGPTVAMVRQDAGALPALAERLQVLEAGFAAWVDAAVAGLPGADRALVAALVDHRTWTALTEAGAADPRGAATELLVATLSGGGGRAGGS